VSELKIFEYNFFPINSGVMYASVHQYDIQNVITTNVKLQKCGTNDIEEKHYN